MRKKGLSSGRDGQRRKCPGVCRSGRGWRLPSPLLAEDERGSSRRWGEPCGTQRYTPRAELTPAPRQPAERRSPRAPAVGGAEVAEWLVAEAACGRHSALSPGSLSHVATAPRRGRRPCASRAPAGRSPAAAHRRPSLSRPEGGRREPPRILRASPGMTEVRRCRFCFPASSGLDCDLADALGTTATPVVLHRL